MLSSACTRNLVFIALCYADHGLDWIEQCFTSPPTQCRLYGRRFLQVKRPNQQYQSTEGESCKGKQQREHKEDTKYTYAYTYKTVDK